MTVSDNLFYLQRNQCRGQPLVAWNVRTSEEVNVAMC